MLSWYSILELTFLVDGPSSRVQKVSASSKTRATTIDAAATIPWHEVSREFIDIARIRRRVDLQPCLTAGGVDPQPLRPCSGNNRIHIHRGRGDPRLCDHPFSPKDQESGVRGQDSDSSVTPDSRPLTPEKEPPQVYGSKPIEIAWTAAPALIVFVLVLVTTRTLWEVDVTPPEPRPGDHALFVTVIGHQWWWEYRYDHYDGKELGFTTANELHIPAARPRRNAPFTSAEVGGRVPQFLGAPAGGQDRSDSGTHQSHVVPDRSARPVPRPVCGILRHPARQHAHPRDRRAAEEFD